MDGINALQLRDNARAELMQIKDIETGFEYLSKVKAIEVWAKAEKKDSELQNLIAEQKIRTQRILGQLIKDGQDAGEIAKQGDYGTLKQNTVNDKEAFTDKPRTLSEIGLTAKESSTFKQIASIPDDVFESTIAEKKEAVTKAVSELTTAGMLKVAKEIKKEKKKEEKIKQFEQASLEYQDENVKIFFEDTITEKKDAVTKAVSELTTAGMLRVAKEIKSPHVSFNSGENEWYTPSFIIEAARESMGNIDLDPASNKLANETVKAENYYTIYDNGLTKKWYGNVWLNPPYSQPEISNFSNKVTELEFTQACVLVNNATETAWFQNMMSLCTCVCFLKGRVKYNDKNGTPANSPLQGQAVLYFGSNAQKFSEVFNKYGIVLWMMKEGK